MEKQEKLQKIKVQGYDKETSEKYTIGQDSFFNIEKVEDGATIETIERIHEILKHGPIKIIVDIGCGSNIHYLQLWKETADAHEITGIEPSPHMRTLLEQKITLDLKEGIVISEGNWSDTHLQTDSVDLVVSRFSLHNIKNIADGYRELSRILKSGGHAIISLPHPGYCKNELEKRGIQAVEGTPMSVNVFDAILHYYYHELESYLGSNLAEQGLELVESKSLNWGTKYQEEANIDNTLIFTIRKK